MNRREAIAALTALPAVARITRADLQPDDVLVVECDRRISQEEAARIRDLLEKVWPGRKAAVFGEGMHLKVVSTRGSSVAGSPVLSGDGVPLVNTKPLWLRRP